MKGSVDFPDVPTPEEAAANTRRAQERVARALAAAYLKEVVAAMNCGRTEAVVARRAPDPVVHEAMVLVKAHVAPAWTIGVVAEAPRWQLMSDELLLRWRPA